MVRSKMIPLGLTFVFVFGFCGFALADGGAEGAGCACNPWPEPTKGQFIRGDFTVAFDKEYFNDIGYEYYVMQVTLKMDGQEHLFSRSLRSSGVNICDYTASELKEIYKKVPCVLGVEEDFVIDHQGPLQGVPVIADLTIEKRDFCGTKSTTCISCTKGGLPACCYYPPSDQALNAMIAGNITIRVVPVKPGTCQ